MYLGIDEVMVQDAPAVIHGHKFEYMYLASIGIYLNYRDMGTRRERCARWVEVAPGC